MTRLSLVAMLPSNARPQAGFPGGTPDAAPKSPVPTAALSCDVNMRRANTAPDKRLRIRAPTAGTAWTLGHSTLTREAFLRLLRSYRLEAIADVRRFPGSRRYPHFNADALAPWLAKHHIEYHWLEALGGRRRPQPESVNTAWRNASFRGYADYMATPEFAEAFADLLALIARRRTALMCSEVLWWRCHRALISDALRMSGIEVIHILDETHTRPHPFTSAARFVQGTLTYEGP